jgi:hypothetical protein
MTAATKTKQQTKLDRLLAQGEWIAVEIDGMKVPYLKMPSPELQSALNGELDKKIKKHLKADGFELLHATRREHPFHSDLLRERIDELAALLGGFMTPPWRTKRKERSTLKLYATSKPNSAVAPAKSK